MESKAKTSASSSCAVIFFTYLAFFSMISTAKSALSDPCTVSTDCTELNQECSDNACQCKSGYTFSEDNNVCEASSVNDLTTSVENENLSILWKMPSRQGRDPVVGFLVKILLENKCLLGVKLLCNDCSSNVANDDSCETKKEETLRATRDDLNTLDHAVSMENILQVGYYQLYTVFVAPISQTAQDTGTVITFQSPPGRPNPVKDISVEPLRDLEANQVYLNITWVPGPYTGPTEWTVAVDLFLDKDKDKIGGSKLKVIPGYNNNTWEVEDLYANWPYQIRVWGRNEAGEGPESFFPAKITTLGLPPGLIQDLQVQEDGDIAGDITLTFKCPLEMERNGTITGYMVRKRSWFAESIQESNEYEIRDPLSPCDYKFLSKDVGGLVVNTNYSFEVMTMTTEFNGSYSPPVLYFARPKLPVLSEQYDGILISRLRLTEPSPNSIAIQLCSSCLVDPKQGVVLGVGLVICVRNADNKCPQKANNPRLRSFSEIPSLTWAEAKSNGFNESFRITPDNWLEILKADQTETYKFTIGENENCTEDTSVTEYCNGPIPKGATVIVSLFKCNEVACDEFLTGQTGLFGTAGAHSDDGDHNTGRIVGIVLGVVAGAIILMIIVYIIYKRKTNSRSFSTTKNRDLSSDNNAI